MPPADYTYMLTGHPSHSYYKKFSFLGQRLERDIFLIRHQLFEPFTAPELGRRDLCFQSNPVTLNLSKIYELLIIRPHWEYFGP